MIALSSRIEYCSWISLNRDKCENLQLMSESVFVVLCQIVGTSQLVAMRRETVGIKEMVDRIVRENNDYIIMISGSHREGFRLQGSDMDIMIWPNNHRVIMDMSHTDYYNTANTTLILTNSSESPPGYTLLELLTPTKVKDIRLANVRINDSLYISSSIYRRLTCSLFQPSSTVHGPCGSGDIGGYEFDSACCFVSDFWPPSAFSWVDRCHSWPNPGVVEDIVKNGCHFVAVGHPLGLFKDEEWRISFSQAEQKCVNAMNHGQFLIYGLLKLFLKEVINQQSKETDELLCSYHMKTAVFWSIQQNTIPHSGPQNFLAGFWVCFKLLLQWVYNGFCPNFFIPQNNLFLTKVYGSAQNRLFLRLLELYEEDLVCLFKSSSIRAPIINALYHPRANICTAETIMMSDIELTQETLGEITRNDFSFSQNLHSSVKCLDSVQQMVITLLTQNEVVMLQTITASILQNAAFVLHNSYKSVNKQMYIVDKVSCHMLKLAARFGCVSDMLYIAMYYYKTFRYKEALSVIKKTKFKLTQPYLMYYKHVDKDRYTEAVRGHSWSTKIRQAVAWDVKLYNKLYYINELAPEQQASLQNKWPSLYIPVFAMSHFLEFLCYRHIDTTLSQAALDELHVLVHHDQGRYINNEFRDISWEILGICQQITGNFKAALCSYRQSLKQYPWHRIQTVTEKRIDDVRQLIQSC